MSTAVTNKFKGSCETCGTHVAARAGKAVKVAGRWKVRCAPHAPATTARARTTEFRTVDGGVVRFSDDTDAAVDAMRDGFIERQW